MPRTPRGQCSIVGCEGPHLARGLCRSHYYSQRAKAIRQVQRAVVKVCASCGIEYSGRNPNAIYCSSHCKEVERTKRRVIPSRKRPMTSGRCCEWCGSSIDHMAPQAKWCDPACFRQARADEGLREFNAGRVCRICDQPLAADVAKQVVYCSAACRRVQQRAAIYGITGRQWVEYRRAAGGCEICADPAADYIDHSHVDGSFRGVLCTRCNAALGLMLDDPARLRAAAEYLEAHASV